MINKTQNFWNKKAKRYDNNERRFEAVIIKEVIFKTKEYLNKSDEVLDFGCATGTRTLELAGTIKQIHGLDISDEMIKEATKKKNELNILNASFIQGSIFKNDFKKASFDKIISYGVIHLLDDSKKVIQRIHELLKPDGIFISTTACLKDKMAIKNRLEFSAYLLIKRLGFFPIHVNMLKTNDVENLVVNENFQIVQAEKIFHGITISFIVARKL
jgi:2-polyprenyl-3-methyl-5-hydroxy-6-metoxy-1,4-benzoquinol methylase